MFNSNSNGGYSLSDIAAATGNGYNNGGVFGNGDGAWWIFILFIIFICFGGWNNGGWGGNNNNGFVPYVVSNNTDNEIQRGFDQNAIMTGLNGISNSLSNGFANAEISRCNAQANVLQTLNNNQMGLYQTLNGNQNATIAAMNGLASGLQNCCCENRAGLADLKYTIATEACADRSAVTTGVRDIIDSQNAGVRDIIANQTAGIQTILDKMCQQEIDALKTQNANLQTQINLANLKASQTDQTAKLLADNAAQTQALEQYLNPAPIPAYVVQNPSCCNQGFYGCGCSA